MANKIVNHPFDPFNHADFDVISTEIEGKTKMKEIEEVIEKKRKDIFDILSTGRAN
jgi:DNA-directed RNA polymerase alpha subunit